MDAYYNTPKRNKMENIATKEVMDRLDMFQARFGKVDEFGWWDMERIQTYAVTQFNSKGFQGDLYIRGV